MKSFTKLSKYAGMREDLVQASGGNTAYKLATNKMVIKASGFQLADLTEETGYAIVNPKVIREAFLNCDSLDNMTEQQSKDILSKAYIEGQRPSIETFLHSISGKYSLHTHSVVVNILTCRKQGREILLKLFPEALIVPYATPGVELAKAYFKEYKLYMNNNSVEPKYVFLMNHGLLVSADTMEEVVNLTEYVTHTIEEYLGLDYSAYRSINLINEFYEDGITWLVTDRNVLDAYREMNSVWEHSFCPDCVVFLGKKMYSIKSDKLSKHDFAMFYEQNGYPVIVEYKGNLYIHAESVRKAMEIQSVLSFSAQVMMYNKDVETNILSEDEKNFLLDWDAEKYRKNMK